VAEASKPPLTSVFQVNFKINTLPRKLFSDSVCQCGLSDLGITNWLTPVTPYIAMNRTMLPVFAPGLHRINFAFWGVGAVIATAVIFWGSAT
jgi:hypothetical protein